MHELAIVQGVLDISCKAAAQNGAARITAIHIRMGDYCGVVPRLLREYFAIAAAGTLAAGAALDLQRVPVTMGCRACGWQGQVSLHTVRCAACGGTDLKMLTGREFYVDNIEVEAPPAPAAQE